MNTQFKAVERRDSSFHRTLQSKAHRDGKVDLNNLVNRLNLERKKERKHNLILSVAAVSAVAVFGIILTL